MRVLVSGTNEDYVQGMASVLTVREQQQTSAAARRVGGYDELLRLERERRQLAREGATTRVARDAATGRIVIRRA